VLPELVSGCLGVVREWSNSGLRVVREWSKSSTVP
jgi:hypothetical protein